MAKAVSKACNPFIIGDYETGGFESADKPVTEAAFVAIHGDTLEEIGRFEAYLLPDETAIFESDVSPEEFAASTSKWKYTKTALELTGISKEMLYSEGIPLKEFAAGEFGLFDLANKTSGQHYKPILVGQNFQFDIPFMQRHAFETKWDLKKLLQGDYNYFGQFQPAYLDLMFLGKMMFQGSDIANFKLGSILDKLGLDLNDAHRAMNDVLGTKDGFVQIINVMRNGSAEVTKQIGRVREHFQFV